MKKLVKAEEAKVTLVDMGRFLVRAKGAARNDPKYIRMIWMHIQKVTGHES